MIDSAIPAAVSYRIVVVDDNDASAKTLGWMKHCRVAMRPRTAWHRQCGDMINIALKFYSIISGLCRYIGCCLALKMNRRNLNV